LEAEAVEAEAEAIAVAVDEIAASTSLAAVFASISPYCSFFLACCV